MLSLAAVVLALVTVADRPSTAVSETARNAPGRSISWLSLGDSYSAGEGATAATGHCQRSPNAAGPKAATIMRTERGWQIGPEAFAACTGGLAADAFNSRSELQTAKVSVFDPSPVAGLYPPGSELSSDTSLDQWARAQGKPPGRFDVIVASLSGNDVGFADIVIGCTDIIRRLGNGANSVLPSLTASPWEAFVRTVAVPKLIDAKDPPGCGDVVGDELRRRVDALFTGSPFPSASGSPMQGRRGSLMDIYRALAHDLLAKDGVFIVMGYPRLIVPSSDWGGWRGDQCNLISRADADALGRAAEHYDDELRQKVEGIGPQFAYVSRREIFDDNGNYHSLCGRTVEWINTPLLFLRDGTLRKERGFHPNDLGYLATAENVAGVVQSRLGVAPPPPSTQATEVPDTQATQPPVTTSPTVRSSEQHYGIGDSFSARCTIAWPTAPSRGVDNIQMRTFCPGVPDQFLFVDIVYDDPDLPVTPSRSTMQVKGEIVDISRSEFGFTVLIVHASHVELTS